MEAKEKKVKSEQQLLAELDKARKAEDDSLARKIRRELRAIGHKGGLRKPKEKKEKKAKAAKKVVTEES